MATLKIKILADVFLSFINMEDETWCYKNETKSRSHIKYYFNTPFSLIIYSNES